MDTSQLVENAADQSIAEPRKVEKISINYARTAKIVDVKALKRNMWRQLATDPTTVRIVILDMKFSLESEVHL